MKDTILKNYKSSRLIAIAKYSIIGIIIGRLALSFSPNIALGLVIGCILAYVSYEFPDKALLILALLMPFWLEWENPLLFGMKLGVSSIAILFLIVGFLLRIFTNKQTLPTQIPLLKLWLAFISISILAYINSPYFFFDISKIWWHIFRAVLRFPLVYIIIILGVTKKEQYKQLIFAMILSATLVSVFGIFQTVAATPFNFLYVGLAKSALMELDSLYGSSRYFLIGTNVIRSFSTFAHANAFAGYLVMTCILSMSLYLHSNQKNSRKYLLFASVIQLLALLLTFSRGGWIAFSFASFIMLTIIFRRRKARLMLVMGVIIFLIIVSSYFAPGQFSNRLTSVTDASEQSEIISRSLRWKTFFKMILEHPILGKGEAISEEYTQMQTPHNLYLDLAITKGIPALFIFLTFVIAIVIRSIYLYNQLTDRFLKGLLLGIGCCLIGLLTHGLVDVLIDIAQINLMFWFLCGIIMSIFFNMSYLTRKSVMLSL